jgi:hypothetical protein
MENHYFFMARSNGQVDAAEIKKARWRFFAAGPS